MKEKIEKKQSIIQSIEGNKCVQVKWKENSAKMDLSHIWLQAMKVGTRGKSLSIPLNLQQAVAAEKINL